ncbi:putative RNA methylase [Aurantimonas manganoxydans SI85-9A1]|uniref:Putative RNA methylase n=2 Tax=Aurantimonas manganoxydans TaxID=651183 RepID=Q1YJQ7_AURMS|nr:putative RNA methylase [Aurantimonas manganoxydans SI85-9A1]
MRRTAIRHPPRALLRSFPTGQTPPMPVSLSTIAIDDPSDPRVEPFRNVRDRDLVGREGFIAEGTVVLDQLLVSRRFRPTSLLILRNRLAGLAERLARFPGDAPIHVADQAVFDGIAGFAVHRGVLAHGAERGARPSAADTIAAAGGRPIIIAVGLSNHDNLGAIFRNAAAFGAGAVLCDTTSCHPLYRKALRVSVGTALTVPWCREGTGESLVAACRAAGYRVLALSPAGETPLAGLVTAGRTALCLGAEGQGLSPDLMRAVETVRIEMAPGLDSLNVATSAAIVLHRLFAGEGTAA